MPAEVWRFEDFELDPIAYRLRHKDRIVHLERIPFELLRLLVERRGKLVTREEILEKVWGKGVFVGSENSINTAVRKIRRALNDDADAPRFIITVPARGYRFVASIHETNATVAIARSEAPAVGAFSAQNSPLPLPEKPSIVVLPFTNLSGDREQEYFSDGLTDDLITSLARLPGLFVIARTSAFTYKGRAIKVQHISQEVGVRFVLDGSVRRAGNQVRVTAQLVDAATGGHLWAERYDRPMKDIFALQDEIVRRIVTTLNLQFSLWDKCGQLVTKRTDNLEAYDDFLRGLRGLEYAQSATKAGNEQARRLYQKAIEVDPDYSVAFASLAFTYLLDWGWRWSKDPHDLDRALELGQHATALDDSQPLAHALLGATYLFKREHDQALAEGRRAIVLDPNFAPAYFWMAETLTFSGKPAKAVGLAQKAMGLDPRNQDRYLIEIGRAYNRMGRYAETVSVIKRNVAHYPNNLAGHVLLAVAYAELGQAANARAEGEEVQRISPNFSLEGYKKMIPDIDRVLIERRLADLRKAGLK